MTIPPRPPWLRVLAVTLLPLTLAGVIIAGPLPPIANPFAAHPVLAAQVEPVATATPEVCEHVATAGGIKIYYCEDINLFIDQLGFMAFEP